MKIYKVIDPALPLTEGLVFMGAGGDPQEWVREIPKLLAEEKIAIVSDESLWKSAYVIQLSPLRTDIILEFDIKKVHLQKLALWRITNRHIFDVKWWSDYKHDWFSEPLFKEE